MHIEVRKQEGGKWTHSWWDGEFSSRFYAMFYALGLNGREEEQVVPLRGCPEDISYETLDEVALKIDSEMNEVFPHDRYCTREDAESYHKNGTPYYDEERIFDPDFHSFGWCSISELEECLASASQKIEYYSDYVFRVLSEWRSVIAYMKSMESDGLFECRAVYCFDN